MKKVIVLLGVVIQYASVSYAISIGTAEYFNPWKFYQRVNSNVDHPLHGKLESIKNATKSLFLL